MESVKSIVSHIKQLAIERSIDVESEISSYDRKHTGVISIVSLSRWLSSVGIRINSTQFEALSSAYPHKEGFDYRRFLSDLECSTTVLSQTVSRPPPCKEELRLILKELNNRRQTLREALGIPTLTRVTPDLFYKTFMSTPITRMIVRNYLDPVTGDFDASRLDLDLETVRNNDEPVVEPEIKLPSCFEALARFFKQRSIDALFHFQRNDTHSTGIITARVFSSTLSSICSCLSPKDIQFVTEAFSDQNGMCQYKRFCKELSQFNPSLSPRVLEASMRSSQANFLPKPEKIIEEVKKQLISRRVPPISFFEGDLKNGKIHIKRFAQIMKEMKLSISNEEIEIIGQHLTENDNMISIHHFCSLVSKEDQPLPNLDTLVNDIRTFLYKEKKTLRPTVLHYDPRLVGHITAVNFMSAMGSVGFSITPQEATTIREAYPGPGALLIDYNSFCNEVDPSFVPICKTINEIAEEQLNTDALSRKHTLPESLILLLSQMRYYLESKRIDLLSLFQKRDFRRRGLVTQIDFEQIIESLIMRLTMVDIRLLTSYYRYTGSSEIRYTDLCRDIQASELQSMELERSKSIPPPHQNVSDPLPELTQLVRSFMRKLKAFCISRSISLSDLFIPYDKSKSGLIPVSKTMVCFNNVGFQISREEAESLVSTFRDSKRFEYLNYRVLIESYETVSIETKEAISEMGAAPVSTDVEREAMRTTAQIREKLMARHRSIRTSFVGIVSPLIPSSDFQRRLESLNIVLLAGQISALVRKYRVNIKDDIRWEDFCKDVETSKTI